MSPEHRPRITKGEITADRGDKQGIEGKLQLNLDSPDRYSFDYRPPQAQLELDWLITNQCNFDCLYCYPQIKARIKSLPEFERRSVKETVRAIDALGKTAHCIISGGEPFMFPKFVDLSALLTRQHYMSVYTNFSTSNVYEFAERVNPEKVGNVFPAFHAQQRQGREGAGSTEEYISKVLYFQDRGFNIHGIYVVHPTVLDRFKEDVNMLRSAGIRSMNVKIFKGKYDGKVYPEAYTDEEKGEIVSFPGSYPHNTPYMEGKRSFWGLRCDAGVRFLKIEPNGTVYRCASIARSYGNIYEAGTVNLDEEAKPCTAKRVLSLTNCMSYLVDHVSE